MHDHSASRISGRTRAAVPAMCVRTLRITVLKSAGNFTRDECLDLNPEKIRASNVLCHEVRNLLRANNFRTPAEPAPFENFRLCQLPEVAVYFAMSGLTRKHSPIGRGGMSAGGAKRVLAGRAARVKGSSC